MPSGFIKTEAELQRVALQKQRIKVLKGVRHHQGLDYYEEWLKKEGIPLYECEFGYEDVFALPRKPWARVGGKATYVETDGIKQSGARDLYAAEIPAGGAWNPEKHLYEEVVYIFKGRGLTEVWNEGQEKKKITFEWGEGSLFAFPTNAWHRLVNGGPEPVLILGRTGAPLLLKTFCNAEFIFNCPWNFTDRFTGKADYFAASDQRTKVGEHLVWETNFVPDLRTCFMTARLADDLKARGMGGFDGFNMQNFPGMHIREMPARSYEGAHYHGPGGIHLELMSEGYDLVWHRKYGVRPFQDGHGDQVRKVPWKIGGVFGQKVDYFHQHHNLGQVPGRQLAIVGGSIGFTADKMSAGLGFAPMGDNVREGGMVIAVQDEDPEIRRMFVEELRKRGLKLNMPPVVYRTDKFREPDFAL